MLLGQQVGWDATTIYIHYDLTTKLTALYLLASGLVYLALAVKFLVTAGRTQNHGRLRVAERIALNNLDKWARLTVLILFAYSTTEGAGLFWSISTEKMMGISALSGDLARILSMWVGGLWLLVSIWIASWILSGRVIRSKEVRESLVSRANKDAATGV